MSYEAGVKVFDEITVTPITFVQLPLANKDGFELKFERFDFMVSKMLEFDVDLMFFFNLLYFILDPFALKCVRLGRIFAARSYMAEQGLRL